MNKNILFLFFIYIKYSVSILIQQPISYHIITNSNGLGFIPLKSIKKQTKRLDKCFNFIEFKTVNIDYTENDDWLTQAPRTKR